MNARDQSTNRGTRLFILMLLCNHILNTNLALAFVVVAPSHTSIRRTGSTSGITSLSQITIANHHLSGAKCTSCFMKKSKVIDVKRKKRKIICSSLFSLFTSFCSPFIFSASAQAKIVTPATQPSNQIPAKKAETKGSAIGSNRLIVKCGTVAILVVGVANSQRRGKTKNLLNDNSVEEKKIQFDKILGKTSNTTSDETKGRASEALESVSKEDPPLPNPDDAAVKSREVKLRQDIENKRTQIKAAAVAKTIAEATERARKESEAKKQAMLLRKAEEDTLSKPEKVDQNMVTVEDSSMQSGGVSQDIIDNFEKESQEKSNIDEGKNAEKSEVEVIENAAKTKVVTQSPSGTIDSNQVSLEEQAFNMLVNLGMIELSRDPDSDDYDHSDDNEIATL